MGRKLSIAGRVLFCAVLITQSCLLVKYVVKYEEKGDYLYWLFVLLFLPGFIAWLVVWCKRRINWLWLVWLFYTLCALTPMVGWIFRRIVIENKLDSADFWGPNSLKAILCITPVLMLLLLQSTPDPYEYGKYRGILNELCFRLTLDLFDGIEMLQVLLGDCDETLARFQRNWRLSYLPSSASSFSYHLWNSCMSNLRETANAKPVRKCFGSEAFSMVWSTLGC